MTIKTYVQIETPDGWRKRKVEAKPIDLGYDRYQFCIGWYTAKGSKVYNVFELSSGGALCQWCSSRKGAIEVAKNALGKYGLPDAAIREFAERLPHLETEEPK